MDKQISNNGYDSKSKLYLCTTYLIDYTNQRSKGKNITQDVHSSALFLCRIHPENIHDDFCFIYLMEAMSCNYMLLEQNLEYFDNETVCLDRSFFNPSYHLSELRIV